MYKNISKLSKLFEKMAQVESPNIIIEPSEPTIQKAVDILKIMDPNYFKGISKIVVAPSGQYGHVESGPDKDPTVININGQRILQESGGQVGAPAILAAVTTIAHEAGHVRSFDDKQGFVGGESPAMVEEQKVAQWIKQNMGRIENLL